MEAVYVDVDPENYYYLHPRPVYLLVSRGDNGYNVMAVSWVTPVSEEPPMLAVAISREAYTLELLEKHREFTLNVVGSRHLDTVYKAGTLSGRRVDKWGMLNLEPLESREVSVPGIKGAYAVYECRVRECIDAGECRLVLADILAVHVLRELYSRYGWELKKADVLLHFGGRVFTTPGRILFAKK